MEPVMDPSDEMEALPEVIEIVVGEEAAEEDQPQGQRQNQADRQPQDRL